MQISLLLWVFFAQSITVGGDHSEVISTSLKQISALNPTSKHQVTLDTLRVVIVRWGKVFVWIIWSPRQPSPWGNFVNPYWIIKCANIPLSFSFPRSIGHSGWLSQWVIFTSLIRISALNATSKHHVTLKTLRVVMVRRAKVFVYMKKILDCDWLKTMPLGKRCNTCTNYTS